MSAVILVEQRPPFILMLASRVPTYTHIVISFLAVLLIQAFPSWAIAKPPVREVTRKRRSSSLTSNTSTLVDPIEADASKKDMNKQEKEKRHHVSFSNKIPFNRLGSSIKMAISRSKSMKPKLPRRLSLPARRFSTHIVAALHNLTPHHRPHDSDSYFSNEKSDVDVMMADNMLVENDERVTSAPKYPVVAVTQTKKTEVEESVVTQREPGVKRKTLRQVVRRASMLIDDIIHRS
ncbi:hypothetical protein C0995_000539 [Termitomyces sp. Mi166|nr:hypothetical protein C0995_000539 [Termitomyces sp. Mi166\